MEILKKNKFITIVLILTIILINDVFYYFSQNWPGYEIPLAVITVVFFILVLLLWKKLRVSGVVLVIATATALFTINSIFFLALPTIFGFSFTCVIAAILLLVRKQNRDVWLTSVVLCMINILVHLEMSTYVSMYIIIFISSIAMVVGFKMQYTVTKWLYMMLFSFNVAIMIIFASVSSFVELIGLVAYSGIVCWLAVKYARQGKREVPVGN